MLNKRDLIFFFVFIVHPKIKTTINGEITMFKRKRNKMHLIKDAVDL